MNFRVASQVPSETDKAGFGTACGRGVYTTSNFQKALQYAITHVLDDAQLTLAGIKVVMLVAIPGVHAQLQGKWVHDPNAPKGKRYKLEPMVGDETALQSTQQRGQLATTGTFRHWTIWNNTEEEEETSSMACIVGFFVLLSDWRLMTKQFTRGSQDPRRGFIGWEKELEPPPGRPRPGGHSRSRSRSKSRAGRKGTSKGKGKGKAPTGQAL